MISILASGHGLASLLRWQSASGCVPESLQLDAHFDPRPLSGINGSASCEVSFRFQRNRSRWLSQALRNMNSAWRLTWWSILAEPSESSETYGPAGVGGGEEVGTRFITEPDRINS